MASKSFFVPIKDFPYAKESVDDRTKLNVLEISTRSEVPFGKSLSPFNLAITLKSGRKVKVECAYQGSKVLSDGHQYPEIYWGSPRDAALDKRIKGVAPAGFNFFGKEYPTEPKHAFFNWLYIIGLCQRKDGVFEKLIDFDGYSDIFYSPIKDPNCQARAAAIYVSLITEGLIGEDTPSQDILNILLGN